MERLRARVANVLTGLWFVPGATAVVLAALAVVLVEVDRAAGTDGVSLGFDGDAAAARGILTVVAGSLITVVALTFSLTVVTLQLVAGQFTPRAVRGLLADRLTQVVAGVFVGSVAYAFIVLRSVREPGDDGGALRPALSTTGSIVLALVSLALLVVFVHHVAHMIQVSAILSRVGRTTVAAVDRLYADDFLRERDDDVSRTIEEWRAETPQVTARPARPGYVQAIALDDLERCARGAGVRVAVHVQPGDFVTPATCAIEVWGVDDAETMQRVATGVVVVADERDLRQDALFGLQQLADIGVRALSPGINDPTTAVTAVGYVRAILELVATRELSTGRRELDGGRVQIAATTPGFREFVEVGIVEIGRFARADARVVCTVLHTLAAVADAARTAGAHPRALTVASVAREIAEPALAEARGEADRRALEACLARVHSATARTQIDA